MALRSLATSYISQLLTGQTVRVDQTLQILNVIDVDPADFFGEIFRFGKFSEIGPGRRGRHAAPSQPDAQDGSTLLADLRHDSP